MRHLKIKTDENNTLEEIQVWRSQYSDYASTISRAAGFLAPATGWFLLGVVTPAVSKSVYPTGTGDYSCILAVSNVQDVAGQEVCSGFIEIKGKFTNYFINSADNISARIIGGNISSTRLGVKIYNSPDSDYQGVGIYYYAVQNERYTIVTLTESYTEILYGERVKVSLLSEESGYEGTTPPTDLKYAQNYIKSDGSGLVKRYQHNIVFHAENTGAFSFSIMASTNTKVTNVSQLINLITSNQPSVGSKFPASGLWDISGVANQYATVVYVYVPSTNILYLGYVDSNASYAMAQVTVYPDELTDTVVDLMA